MRMRKKPWAGQEIIENNQIIKEPNKLKGIWNSIFNNQNPIYLELGCGKGNFITETAKLNSEINYIAIEHQISVIAIAARKLKNELIPNIRFIYGDANLLNDYFEKGEIKRIYINFCDPWPKNKWEKRRLTYRKFLDLYKYLMNEHGEVHFKTDNKELFEFSLKEFKNSNWELKNISLDLHNSDFVGNIMTEYEQKFSQQGMPIYRCEAIIHSN